MDLAPMLMVQCVCVYMRSDGAIHTGVIVYEHRDTL